MKKSCIFYELENSTHIETYILSKNFGESEVSLFLPTVKRGIDFLAERKLDIHIKYASLSMGQDSYHNMDDYFQTSNIHGSTEYDLFVGDIIRFPTSGACLGKTTLVEYF